MQALIFFLIWHSTFCILVDIIRKQDRRMKFNADIVRKYLNRKFSLDDKIIVDEYFDNDQYSRELNGVLKEHWENSEQLRLSENKDLDPLLDKINHQILLTQQKNKGRIKSLWQLYSKVAAILLVPVLIFSIYDYRNSSEKHTNTSWVEVHSPHGARTQFSLPDGSTGWLNSGSVIRYPARFGSNRTVAINGEAYFEVVKNPDAPFIVETKQIKVKVLGTSFNVVSFNNDSITEVVVASGKVELTTEGKELNEVLLASDRLVLNRSKNRFSRSKVEIQNYTSWKDGKLIFLNDPLDEVIRKISRYYLVDFTVDEQVDRKQLFRAIMEDESLEEVLRYMKLTMNIDFAIQERKPGQGDRISKRKVIITNTINN